MDNMGANGANGANRSDIIPENNFEDQFDSGIFENFENLIEASEEEFLMGFQAALGLDDNQLGLNHLPQMNPESQEHDILQINQGDGSPSLYNLQSPPNSSGSESSTNVIRTDNMNRASDLLMAVSVGADPNRTRIIQQATEAVDELIKMATIGEPLWEHGENSETETLNGLQYLREFNLVDATLEEIIRMAEVGEPQMLPTFDGTVQDIPQNIPSPVGFEPLNIEASRAIGYVNMNATNIVELLMNYKQWSTTFSSIVSRATLLGVILDSVDGSYNGVLHVMTAEFHQSTPLIPSRQSYFARHCKNMAYGTWVVVDVSLENLFPYPQVQFRRRPSGCLIQEMPNGSCKITWVEHVEVDNRSLHPLFVPIVTSGFAFNAKRWIAMISRHCQWLATLMARPTPTLDGILISVFGRASLLKLADIMTRNFFMNISSCTENFWTQLPMNVGAENVRFRYGKTLLLPGKPPSSTMIFTTSIRIPVPVNVLFDFLRDERSRHKWDMLSEERLIRELAYVLNGENPQNRVSIMQINSSPMEIEIMYLQESFSDETGSYVVYAPMEFMAMSAILNGGDPNFVAILSSGFSILPDKTPGQGNEPVGSILTIAFHSADGKPTNEPFIPEATLRTMDTVLAKTASSIKDAIMANIFGMPYSRN